MRTNLCVPPPFALELKSKNKGPNSMTLNVIRGSRATVELTAVLANIRPLRNSFTRLYTSTHFTSSKDLQGKCFRGSE